MQYDLHTHVLPGIDDGSPDMDVSLGMLRLAIADGTTHVAATPHASSRNYLRQLAKRDEALAMLREEAARNRLDIRIVPGMEICLDDHVWDLLEERPQGLYGAPRERSENTPLLAEIPWGMDLSLAADVFFQAQLRGYVVVLAHPERYLNFSRCVDLLKGLLDKGIYLQFNATSFPGWSNLLRRRNMLRLLRHAPEHVLLGSDAHDLDARPPALSPARPYLEKALGESGWSLVAEKNPAGLLGMRWARPARGAVI